MRNPVPIEQIELAELVGMPGVRGFWDRQGVNQLFQRDIINSIRDEPHDLFRYDADGLPSYSGLAISGGGSSGAFGAGILCVWSSTDTRPQFKLVTGISTGALIAPYAFLGQAYDAKLKAVFTTISTKNIVRLSRRIPFRIDSLTDTSPLAKLIAKDVNEAMIVDIAAAHAQGQRLYIGTTNLDAQRFVVWNMGAIAASNDPAALDLFRNVMLASASIPGAFSPVYIDVVAGGQIYDEMHVDGGVFTQVFFYEFMLDIRAAVEATGANEGERSSGAVYVIRNGKAGPEPEQTPREILAIAQRAISTMIKSASLNDLLRIYQLTRRDQIDFNYADIPEDFQFKSQEVFDREEMIALFDLGYQMVSEGRAWQKAPFESSQVE